jgi:hypothetical protein
MSDEKIQAARHKQAKALSATDIPIQSSIAEPEIQAKALPRIARGNHAIAVPGK